MAITFDDLPTVGFASRHNDARLRMTKDLLATLAQRNISATGFVNEQELYADGQIDTQRVALLTLWLDAGHGLGNHTYSHPDLNQTPLTEFQADVLRGEPVTRDLLDASGQELRFFQHPYLRTGADLETKSRFEAFLAGHGYKVAPVTIDNSDWIYARAYDLALDAGKVDPAKRIGIEYVSYMIEVTHFYEQQSRRFFDRNIDHVLLVHANQLNAAWFGALANRLSARGYEFISLDEALRDSAYSSADRYTGPAGISWLHRWAITQDVDRSMFRGEPETPAHILELAGLGQ